MGSFDDFMIGQTTRQSEELRRTQQELRGVEAQRDALAASHAELRDALQRIAHAKADGLDGARDTMVLERAIKIAANALTCAKEIA